MARKHMHASKGASPAAADDFTRIAGIGPITMKRLHSAGICTFAQLAALSAEGIASLIPNLPAKQVTNQGWIRQAREQASSKAASKIHEKEPAISASRQHYENFTLEFLLAEKNKVRRLQIVHVQSRDVDTWTKWDPERLMDFLARHTGARLPYVNGVVPASVKSKPTSRPTMGTEQASEVATGTDSIPSAATPEEKIHSTTSSALAESTAQVPAPSDLPFSQRTPSRVPSSVVPASTISRIRLLEWKTLLSSTQKILQNLPHDQCFDVNLTLDLTSASLPETSQLNVTTSLYAKKLGDAPRKLIREMRSTIPYGSIINLNIEHATLPQGLYRLEAFLILVPTDLLLPPSSGINASFQGPLIQVY
jgi:hypothetical protein